MSTSAQRYPTSHCQCIFGDGQPSSQLQSSSINSYQHINTETRTQRTTEVDDIIIQGMNSLSFVELQKEQEDLHGVSTDVMERQEDVARTLIDLEAHLQTAMQSSQSPSQSQSQQSNHHENTGSMSSSNNNNNINNNNSHMSAYQTALQMDPSYVQDRNFRMAFLRANRYDPKAAANQMFRHFSIKLELFGVEPLARHVRLSDLAKDDMDYLLQGSYHISAMKDRANRTILVEIPGRRKFQTIENELKCYFYIYMDVIRASYNDDSSCGGNHLKTTSKYKSGGSGAGCSIVYVNYGIGKCQGTHSDGVVKVFTLSQAMPFHTAGIHLCFNHQAEVMLCKAAIALMQPRMKTKVKVHSGSHLECRYRLSSYGIPYDALPLSFTDNEVIMDYQMAWIKDRLREENNDMSQLQHPHDQQQQNTSTSSKIPPTENDVLCVGWKVNTPGNDRIRQMISKHADWYSTGNSKERRILVDLIRKDIRTHQGRFLKSLDSEQQNYQELSVDEARVKIGQMFRNHKTRVRKLAQKSSQQQQQRQQQQLQKQQQQSIITSIQNQDVLFGRMYEHLGNQQLRLAVENLAEEYNASNRGRKKEIADSLVRGVKDRGGRFLKPMVNNSSSHHNNSNSAGAGAGAGAGKGWVEVSDKQAEQKISTRFRNCRRKPNTHHGAKNPLLLQASMVVDAASIVS